MVTKCIAYQSLNSKLHPNRTLNPIGEYNINLIEPVDVLNPTIRLEYFDKWRDVNNIFIELFNRYYTIEGSPVLLGGMVEFSLHVDVLKTYIDGMRSITCLVDRNEFVYSPYIEDPQLKVRTNRQIEIKKIGSLGSPNGTNFALTVCGGSGGI